MPLVFSRHRLLLNKIFFHVAFGLFVVITMTNAGQECPTEVAPTTWSTTVRIGWDEDVRQAGNAAVVAPIAHCLTLNGGDGGEGGGGAVDCTVVVECREYLDVSKEALWHPAKKRKFLLLFPPFAQDVLFSSLPLRPMLRAASGNYCVVTYTERAEPHLDVFMPSSSSLCQRGLYIPTHMHASALLSLSPPPQICLGPARTTFLTISGLFVERERGVPRAKGR